MCLMCPLLRQMTAGLLREPAGAVASATTVWITTVKLLCTNGARMKGVNMATLLVFEFPSDGPYGDVAAEAYRELAEHIATEEGLRWKVWTENPAKKVAGGVYLFENEADAKRYTAFHTERLAGFGITDIDARSYDVNEALTAITRG